LGDALVKLLREDSTHLMGEPNGNRSNRYVVKKPLCKCTPADVDTFRGEAIIESLLEFFKHYAACEPKFTKVLKRVVGTDEN
jgi:hypothetical protein